MYASSTRARAHARTTLLTEMRINQTRDKTNPNAMCHMRRYGNARDRTGETSPVKNGRRERDKSETAKIIKLGHSYSLPLRVGDRRIADITGRRNLISV